jgi:anti-sigma B factor antagonist
MTTEEFTCGDFTCGAEWIGDSSAVLEISGELDMHNADEVNHVLDRLDERGISDHLVVDLTGCSFIDSIGLSVLIGAQHRARSPLNLVVTNESLRRVFSITGLTGLFTLHETKIEAIEALVRQVGAL